MLATLALERLFELIGYIVLFALSVSFLKLPDSLKRYRPTGSVRWLALVVIFALHGLSRSSPRAARSRLRSRRRHRMARAQVGAYMKHFGRTIGGISTGPRFTVALALSVGIWALQVWTYSLTARAAHFESISSCRNGRGNSRGEQPQLRGAGDPGQCRGVFKRPMR